MGQLSQLNLTHGRTSPSFAGTYMVTGEMVGWAVLAFFLVLSLAMALVQALEMVETIWRRRWTR